MDTDPSGCIITGIAWRDGQVVDSDVRLEEIRDHAHDGTVLWVDLLRPTSIDVRRIADHFGMNETTVEDALAPHERPKVTRHGDATFFTVYGASLRPGTAASNERGRLVTPRISGFVLPNAVVTVRLDESFDMAPVVATWQDNADLLRYGPGALLHGLLDTVVDGHFATIQQLDDEVEALEDELFAEHRTGQPFLRTVYTFRKDLVALRRVVLPMREVVNAILRHRGEQRTPLDAWYDDLYDHVLRAAEWTESLRDMVTTVFETNLSLQDSRLNIIMKKLAGWGAIIAIPTAITGWFGQNVPFPGFQDESGLWMSVVLILVLSIGLYVAFKRRDWL